MKKTAFIFLLFSGFPVLVQPVPGDVFREYAWLREQDDILVSARIASNTGLIYFTDDIIDGQIVPSMEVQWSGAMLEVGTKKQPDFRATAEDYEDRPHFTIETPAMTYYYDIRGGGFSRIIDNSGNDWISFKMKPWGDYPAAAAGAFRGLPNMVFQESDDGAGHPGHDKCDSWLEDRKIVTESLSGKWKWSWEFFNDHAVLQVLKADPGRAYWFLYEGTPGGKFDPENTYFGTSNSGPEKLGYDYFKSNIFRDTFQWMYTGHNQVNRIFYMIHCNADEFPDMISMLGNTDKGLESPDGMTVFGFGRGKEVSGYLQGRQKFIIGFYPKKIENQSLHRELSKFIELSFLKN